MLFYPAALPLSRQTLNYMAGSHPPSHKRIGSCWRKLTPADRPCWSWPTPDLSGIFDVIVVASGPRMPEKQLAPLRESRADISCESHRRAMVGIVAAPDGTDAAYWTVSNPAPDGA